MKKPLKITAYDEEGKRIKNFASINSFRKHFGIKRKLDSPELKKLRRKEAIYISHYLLMATKKEGQPTSINPFLVKTIHKRHLARKRRNVKQLIKSLNPTEIIVFDSNFKFIHFHSGTIKALAKIEKASEGTIKSSCHRIAKGKTTVEHTLKPPIRYYAYRDDLIKFIKKQKIK